MKRVTRSFIGIDIDATSIKVLHILKKKNAYFIERLGSAFLPESAIIHHQIKDFFAVSACLEALISQLKLKGNGCILAIPDARVLYKRIQVDSTTHASVIREQVLRVIKENLSIPLHDLAFDYRILGPSMTMLDRLDILCVACHKMFITERVQLLQKAGLVARAIELKSSAIERAFPLLTSALCAKPTCAVLIELGEEWITLYAMQEKTMRITQEEKLKDKEIALIAVHLESMLNDCKQACAWEKIDNLFFAGESKACLALMSALKDKSVPMYLANPFQGMTALKKVANKAAGEEASAFLIASGLALRLKD